MIQTRRKRGKKKEKFQPVPKIFKEDADRIRDEVPVMAVKEINRKNGYSGEDERDRVYLVQSGSLLEIYIISYDYIVSNNL